MSLNKFLSPNSGPLTSEPAIGWLGINIFFNFLFLLIKFSILRLVEPVSVIRFFEETYGKRWTLMGPKINKSWMEGLRLV